MDYSLPKVANVSTDVSIYRAMPTGGMPTRMLTDKFAVTDMGGECGDDEESYYEYVRLLLTDMGPDTNRFEHEEPRASSGGCGRLQAQYYGHRGSADGPDHPEMCLGFLGPGEADPRGSSNEADMKLMGQQARERAPVTKLYTDADNSITGGGISPQAALAEQQAMFTVVKDRLKTFDRQLGTYVYTRKAPTRNKAYCDLSRGMGPKSEARDNPARRFVIDTARLLKDSSAWRKETRDRYEDTPAANYSAVFKSTVGAGRGGVVVNAGGVDREWGDNAGRIDFGTVALLGAKIAECRRKVRDGAEMEEETLGWMVRKSEGYRRDLSAAVSGGRERGGDIDLAAGNVNGPAGRMARIMESKNRAGESVFGHCTAHHLANAGIIYKSSKLRKICGKMLERLDGEEVKEQLRQNAYRGVSRPTKTGRVEMVGDIAGGDGLRSVNYARMVAERKGGPRAVGDMDLYGSQISGVGKNGNARPSVFGVDDTLFEEEFGSNSCGERLVGKLGTKYLATMTERDARPAEFGGE